MTPPRRPIDRSHVHRSEDIYSPGAGDLPSIAEVGVGEQTVRLLGPFPIAHDTPDLVNPFAYGIALGSVPKDSVVVSVWVVPGEDIDATWAGVGTDPYLQLGVGTPDTGENDIAIYKLTNTSGGAYAFDPSWALARVEPQQAWDEGLSLTAQVYATGGDLNQGAATVFALIASPST